MIHHGPPPGIEILDLFEILSVRPPQPLENSTIEIDFRIKLFEVPLDGKVAFGGNATGDGTSSKDVFAAVGHEARGTVFGLAPSAGISVPITLQYFRNKVEEFLPYRETQMEINVEAEYTVSVDWFEVGNPRNGPDLPDPPASDLISGASAAEVDGQILPSLNPLFPTEHEPTVTEFGRHVAKDRVPTPFQSGPFRGVPGQAPDLKLNYTFINHSYAGSSAEAAGKVHDWLSHISSAIISGIYPGAGPAAKATDDWVTNELDKAQSCDGPLAVDVIKTPSARLSELALDTGEYAEVVHYLGTPAPGLACGEISNYYVRWSVRRISQPLTLVTCGTFGGGGGDPFEERKFPESRLVGGLVRAGARVDAIQLNFTRQRVLLHGGNGGEEYPFSLQEGEYIWGISGRAGARLDAIAFHTNQRVIGPFGGTGGVPFDCGDLNLELVGIFGRSGQEVDAIGALLKRRN